MGNDVRNVSGRSRATLLNPDAIAIDQDPLGYVTLLLFFFINLPFMLSDN